MKKIELDPYDMYGLKLEQMARAVRELQDKVFPDVELCAVPECGNPMIGFVIIGSKGLKIPTCRDCCNDIHNIGPVFQSKDGEVIP